MAPDDEDGEVEIVSLTLKPNVKGMEMTDLVSTTTPAEVQRKMLLNPGAKSDYNIPVEYAQHYVDKDGEAPRSNAFRTQTVVLRKSRFQKYMEALDPPQNLPGMSWGVLPPNAVIRKKLRTLLFHPGFDLFILFLAVGWCSLLWVKNPIEDRPWFEIMDFILMCIYTLEFVLRITCLWFPESLKSGWMWLDFFVVVTMWFEIFVFQVGWKVSLAPFRIWRILLPVRTINYCVSTGSILRALKMSLAPLVYINLSMAFFFFAYTILTISVYGNSLARRCLAQVTDAEMVPARFCKNVLGASDNPDDCPAGTYCSVYENPEAGYSSFDHFGVAMLSLFQIHCMDDWVNRFLNPLLQSEPSFSYMTWIITSTTILFVSLIIINLFVAVIVDTFAFVRSEDLELKAEAERVHMAVAGTQYNVKPPPVLPSGVRQKIRETMEDPAVEWTIAVLILANTFLFLSVREDMTNRELEIVKTLKYVFACIYIVELILRVVGSGAFYFKSVFNIVDSAVIILTLLAIPLGKEIAVIEHIQVVRNLRVIRLFRPLRLLLAAVMQSIEPVVNMVVITAVSILMFAIVGKQLFGGEMSDTRSHFDTVPTGFLTLFQIITGDNWLQSMFAAISGEGRAEDVVDDISYTRVATCLVFYWTFFFWGNYIVQNLLIACILENLHVDAPHADDDDAANMHYSHNPLRRKIQDLVIHPKFDVTMVCIVILSSVIMCLTGPPGRTDYLLPLGFLAFMDGLFLLIFLVEFVLKMIALYPRGYFANPWNVLDFFALAITVADTGVPGGLPGGRVFRALRVVRSLKVVGTNVDMKNVISAILNSMTTLFYVTLLYITLVLLFALFGRSFFGGRLWSCQDEGIEFPLGKAACAGSYAVELASGNVLMPRVWNNAASNFDDSVAAFLSLYQCVHLKWTAIAYNTMDMSETDAQPLVDYSWGFSIFFVLFIFVARFFVASLFVAVIIEYYNIAQAATQPTLLQREYAQTMKVDIPHHLYRTIAFPIDVKRQFLFKIVKANYVRNAAMVVVTFNMVFVSSYHSFQPDYWTTTLKWIDGCCIILYCIESGIKLGALGWRDWKREGWFVFEGVIAVMAAITMLPEYAWPRHWGVMLGRVWRILRVLRFIDFVPSLKHLFRTMLDSAVALVNVVVLGGIISAIFAVMGVNLFGNLRGGNVLTQHSFDTVGRAFTTLFKVTTGDAWEEMFRDAAVAVPECTPDNVDGWPEFGDCGSAASAPYFVPLGTLLPFVWLSNGAPKGFSSAAGGSGAGLDTKPRLPLVSVVLPLPARGGMAPEYISS